MQLGVHVSIAGSIDKAVDNAMELKCTAFQIFTRNPRGWAARSLVKEDVENFKAKLASSRIDRNAVCVHMPYLPNLSSSKKDLYKKSLGTFVNEVKRCGVLGIPFLVIHLGSHLGAGIEIGMKNLVNACNTAAAEAKNDVMILLENMAGQKNSIGSKFEELKQILEQSEPRKRFGVCFDTCHAFAAGYDLRSKDKVQEVIAEFDKYVGMTNLRIVHLNDSMFELGFGKDRHEHIGLGQIGEKGFKAILAQKEFRNLPLILETPFDEPGADVKNLQKVRELAS
ncbi:MAG: deoxyribonuclease-4 [Candidatus Nitrosomirales archaeon]|jgi:deoxyribonuclease-4